MAQELLVDCHNMVIGATPIARPETAAFPVQPNRIKSASDAVFGPAEDDITYYDLLANLTAQDPLIVPTIAALTDAQAIVAEGRLANAATYRKITLAHGVLTGITLDLVDNQLGRSRFDFQNRAASATVTIADERTAAAGTTPTYVDRRGTIRIDAGNSTFTPDGAAAVTLEGLHTLNWQGRAIMGDGERRSSPGAKLVDTVTVAGWEITGSIGFGDKTLTGDQTAAALLAVKNRGTTVVRVRLTGFGGESPPPTDFLVTLQRIKFYDIGEDLRTKQPGEGNLQFGAILRAADNTLLGLGDMISAAVVS